MSDSSLEENIIESFLPQWVSDAGTIGSLIGLIISIILLLEARKIRQSFLRRARLQPITRELKKATSEIAKTMKNWPKDKTPALEQFAIVKGLLENIRPKLPNEEKQNINHVLSKLQPKKFLLFQSTLSELSEDTAWDIYTDLNTIVTSLDQLAKDSKWD